MNREIDALMNIIKSKNVEIKALRETSKAQDTANLILSAFIAIVAERRGRMVISKRAVSEALGKYLVNAVADGENYVISVKVDDGAVDNAAGSEAACGAD